MMKNVILLNHLMGFNITIKKTVFGIKDHLTVFAKIWK